MPRKPNIWKPYYTSSAIILVALLYYAMETGLNYMETGLNYIKTGLNYMETAIIICIENIVLYYGGKRWWR
jgi:predicted aldo/keto reductase-like oxidoreductase